jgi:hypothetical protein
MCIAGEKPCARIQPFSAVDSGPSDQATGTDTATTGTATDIPVPVPPYVPALRILSLLIGITVLDILNKIHITGLVYIRDQ